MRYTKNPAQQAIQALSVYRDRCLVCLDSLRSGDIDSFIGLQKPQQIAFQNFRSLDHRAKGLGWDLSTDPAATAIVRQIQDAFTAIRQLERNLLDEHHQRLEKLSKTAINMRHYGRTHAKAKFVKMV